MNWIFEVFFGDFSYQIKLTDTYNTLGWTDASRRACSEMGIPYGCIKSICGWRERDSIQKFQTPKGMSWQTSK